MREEKKLTSLSCNFFLLNHYANNTCHIDCLIQKDLNSSSSSLLNTQLHSIDHISDHNQSIGPSIAMQSSTRASSSSSPLRNNHSFSSSSSSSTSLIPSNQLIFTTADELTSDTSSDSQPSSSSSSTTPSTSRTSRSSSSTHPSSLSSSSRPAVSVSHLSTSAPSNLHRSFPPPITKSKSRYSFSSPSSSSTTQSNPRSQSQSQPSSSPSNSNPNPNTHSNNDSRRPTGSYQLLNALHIDIAFSDHPPPPGSQIAAPILLSSKSNPPACYFYEVEEVKNRLRSEGSSQVRVLPKGWKTEADVQGLNNGRKNDTKMKLGSGMSTQQQQSTVGAGLDSRMDGDQSQRRDTSVTLTRSDSQSNSEPVEEIVESEKEVSQVDENNSNTERKAKEGIENVNNPQQSSSSTTTISNQTNQNQESTHEELESSSSGQEKEVEVEKINDDPVSFSSTSSSPSNKPSLLPIQSSSSISSSSLINDSVSTPTNTNTTDISTLNSIPTSDSSTPTSSIATSRDEPSKLLDSQSIQSNDQDQAEEDDSLTPTLSSKSNLNPIDGKKKEVETVMENKKEGSESSDKAIVTEVSNQDTNLPIVNKVVKSAPAWGTKKTWSTLASPSVSSTSPFPSTSTTSTNPNSSSISTTNPSKSNNDSSTKISSDSDLSKNQSTTSQSNPTSTTSPVSPTSISKTINSTSTSTPSSSYASHLKPIKKDLETILKNSHLNFETILTIPRGLINKGNLCFANSILQVLIFCKPFYNLFNLVGKNFSLDFNNKTPLMEAMISFLREFQIVKEETEEEEEEINTSFNSNSSNQIKNRSSSVSNLGGGNKVGNSKNLNGINGIIKIHDEIVSEPFVPEFVYEAMRLNKRFDTMRRGHQEDAEEFLGFFLDTLHEEFLSAIKKSSEKLNGIPKVNRINGFDSNSANGIVEGTNEDEIEREREVERPRSPIEESDEWLEVGQKGKTNFTRTTSTASSPITSIFGGKFRSTLQIPGSKGSITLEPYQALQLDIASSSVNTIEDALKQLVLPEIVHGVRSSSNPNSNLLVDATKQTRIETIPPILVIHLKRFSYDNVGGTVKNSKKIRYDSHLKIGEDLRSDRGKEGDGRYKLFGVVYHHGRYATGGHYTVDVLRQDGSSWVHIDDTSFHSVSPENVYANDLNDSSSSTSSRVNGSSSWGPKSHDGLAYLLFYQREDLSENTLTTKNKNVNGIHHENQSLGSKIPSSSSSTTYNSNLNGWSSIGERKQNSNNSNFLKHNNGLVSPFFSSNQIQMDEKSNNNPFISSNKSSKKSNSNLQNQNQNQNQNSKKGNNSKDSSTFQNSNQQQQQHQQQTTTPVKKVVPGSAPSLPNSGKKSKKGNLNQK